MVNPQTPAILLLNIPPGSFCGIDLLSFTTSPRFQGIKNLPTGWHFVFTGTTSTQSIRHGTWFHIDPPSPHPPTLLILKWDPESEHLVPETNPTTLLHHRGNLASLWTDSLTPYRQSASTSATAEPEDNPHDWPRLTDCISTPLLSRITGGPHYALTSASAAPRDVDHIPGLAATEAHLAAAEPALSFLPVELRRTWREGAVGRERTEAARDRSWALGDLLERFCAPDADGDGDGDTGRGEREVVGEVQFAFVMVVTLGNYSCLEQWKRLLGLLLTCRGAVGEREGLFVRVVRGLRGQLRRGGEVEGGLFDMSEEGAGWLRALLVGFRRGVEEVCRGGESRVGDELEELEGDLTRLYGWDLSDSYVRRGLLELEDGERVEMEVSELEGEDERGEYAPVVVDLGESGHAVDNTSTGD